MEVTHLILTIIRIKVKTFGKFHSELYKCGIIQLSPPNTMESPKYYVFMRQVLRVLPATFMKCELFTGS